MMQYNKPDSHTAGIDDLFFVGTAQAIEADDDTLATLVERVELPVLLAALAATTGDVRFVPASLAPPLTPVDTAPHPHGGLSQEQQDEARTLALAGLQHLRANGSATAEALEPQLRDRILSYLSGGHDEWIPMLTHELNVAGSAPVSDSVASSPSAENAFAAHGTDVLIVGAGVAGIAAGYRYRQAGVPFTMIEAAEGVGGTWLKNRYPGVRLDTPTFGYSYSFAQKGDWNDQFAQGHEILAYLEEVVERAGLSEVIEFGTRLISATWNETIHKWIVVTEHNGEQLTREFTAVLSAVGQLDHPNIPDFDGLSDYRGVTVHSQQWTPDIEWQGKRVAVIGTGASAFQIVPALVDGAAEMVVFQRSAPWMLPAMNYHEPLSESFAWFADHVPNFAQWFRLWMVLGGIPGRIHTVTAEADWKGAPLSVSQKNQEVRDYLVQRLRDQFAAQPELAELAIPGYPPGAKRMLRDNGVWADALLRDTTTVVTSGVQRFTETGIVDGAGVTHEVDLVVFATGFTPSDYLDGIEVRGIGGQRIHDYWAGDARAFNGVTVPGFPNFFLLFGPNVGGVIAGSLHFVIERAVEYSLAALSALVEHDAVALDVTEEALQRFVDYVDAGNRNMSWGQPYVSTWYQNSTGRVSQVWPYTNIEYYDATKSISPTDYRFIQR